MSPPNGTIELDVPAGEHDIDVRMGSTPVRRVGDGVSWAMFLIVLGLIFWPQRRKDDDSPVRSEDVAKI